MTTRITKYVNVIADTRNHVCKNYTMYNQNVKFIGEAKFTAREIILMPR